MFLSAKKQIKKDFKRSPYDGDPVGIRTQDPQLRRLLLYPAELPDHLFRLQRYGFFSKCGSTLCKKMQIVNLIPQSWGHKGDADAWA